MRIEYPGALGRVTSRGDRQEDIFHDEVDRQTFLKTLAEACQEADFQMHAYGLMRNHFHLVEECHSPAPEPETEGKTRWNKGIVIV